MKIHPYFEESTSTYTYLVIDEATGKCAVINPVQDFDPESGRTRMKSISKVVADIREQNLSLEWILETHIHADHLTAAWYLRHECGGKTAIGSGIKEVLDFWVPCFNTSSDTPADGSQFDRLLEDGETLELGSLQIDVMHTPGHTPACCTFKIEDALFTGDTIFMPRMGTARCDFPGGSSEQMYHSIQRILAFPDDTRIFVGHDYPPAGESPACETTVGEQKANNIMVGAGVKKAEYIEKRDARDATLRVPRLLLPSIQINLRSGRQGDPEENGISYVKIPLNQF